MFRTLAASSVEVSCPCLLRRSPRPNSSHELPWLIPRAQDACCWVEMGDLRFTEAEGLKEAVSDAAASGQSEALYEFDHLFVPGSQGECFASRSVRVPSTRLPRRSHHSFPGLAFAVFSPKDLSPQVSLGFCPGIRSLIALSHAVSRSPRGSSLWRPRHAVLLDHAQAAVRHGGGWVDSLRP